MINQRDLQYGVGDIIEYRTALGIRRIVVTDRDADVKNGRPGFDGYLVGMDPEASDAGVWGYDSQITFVVRRVAR